MNPSDPQPWSAYRLVRESLHDLVPAEWLVYALATRSWVATSLLRSCPDCSLLIQNARAVQARSTDPAALNHPNIAAIYGLRIIERRKPWCWSWSKGRL
jgi:hypothetical protein